MNGYVLVIDDDPDIREAIRMILDAYGFRVRISGDAHDALSQLGREELPAVILLDMRMPEMSGEEFLSALGQLGVRGRVPVVVLSGDTTARAAARAAGATDFLAKPVEVEELLSTLSRHSTAGEVSAH